MSKSITEKELAEALDDRMDNLLDNNGDLDTLTVARTAAKLLGYEFAPEKPEPGTWHVVAEGPRKGYAAVVQQNGVLVMFNEHGDGYRREPEQDWPALTPACVVSEAEWARVNNDRDVIAEERDKWRDRAGMLDAKSGLLQSDLSDAMDTLTELAPAKPVELTEEEVGELWDAIPGSRGRWREYTGPFQEHVTAVVNAALAKHGHGRVEVSREQVYGCIREVWDSDAAISPAVLTDAIMELLEGSK